MKLVNVLSIMSDVCKMLCSERVQRTVPAFPVCETPGVAAAAGQAIRSTLTLNMDRTLRAKV
jgi:hypothetical protein